jgi:L-ribulokinase
VGLEWFFPKLLETIRHEPKVAAAAEVWLEAGDWLVWQLTAARPSMNSAQHLVRSTCQAGYKALWSAEGGYPSRQFLAAVDPRLADAVQEKMPGRMQAPGTRAGPLSESGGRLLGLPAGIPVSAAIIDAHAGVPGCGSSGVGDLVMVMGTSSCHMINAKSFHPVPGIAGIVYEGILPGLWGYETGQASVGDAFASVAHMLGQTHETLAAEAAKLPPGSGGVAAIDWLNGCRTPLMDGRLSGAFIGLTLGTTAAHLYRAMLEATAFGLRWIVDLLEKQAVPVKRCIAGGGLPGKSPLLMQICADVLGRKILLAESDQSVALGAAILGCTAAGPKASGYRSVDQVVKHMAHVRKDLAYIPRKAAARAYERPYALYRGLAEGRVTVPEAMKALRG